MGSGRSQTSRHLNADSAGWPLLTRSQKLRPFFPPLEPLQSVNLRAALFRALSDLKKNGDLGRETIIRKTMLDDCKGPRFEELLAVFSTAVLRKDISAKAEEPGLRLGLAKQLTEAEFAKLLPLILAQHASLSSRSQSANRVQDNFDQFSRLLEDKSEQLSSRAKDRSQSPDPILQTDTLVQEVKANWLGSQHWADSLLYGACRSNTDRFLDLSFEEAWSRAKKGNIYGLTKPTQTDLLLDLEAFLSQQRDRLRRLEDFKVSLCKNNVETGQKGQAQNLDKTRGLVFKEHQTLTVASISKAVQHPKGRNLLDEHQAILTSMQQGLAQIKGERDIQISAPSLKTRPGVEEPREKNMYYRGALSPIPDEERSSLPHSPSITITTPDRHLRPPNAEMGLQSTDSQPISDLDDNTAANINDSSEPPSSTIDNTSPQESSSPEPDLPPLPTAQFEPRPSTLLERTRQSMSLLPPQATTRPRQSSAFHRLPRQSQNFPINQFATPPKPQAALPSRSGASTPHDELFSEDADYASVFKSRPRIAMSPSFSPAVHNGYGEEDDEDGESVSDLAVDESPSKGVRMR